MPEDLEPSPMTIGIVGLGYVGLPLAVHFAEAGDRVIVIDIDKRKIEAIGLGESYIEDVASSRLAAVKGQFLASDTVRAVGEG